MRVRELRLDELKPWSEVKLAIVARYVETYAKILARYPRLHTVYADAFAGAGRLVSETDHGLVEGSPLVALGIKPGFSEYHFIESDPRKAAALAEQVGGCPNVSVHPGDCNEVLRSSVLPLCRFDQYRRGLWVLDAYSLDYRWETVAAAGRAGSIEILLNWSIMAVNRTAALLDPDKITESSRERMDRFWGDGSWYDVIYSGEGTLFPGEIEQKTDYRRIVLAYCERLRTAAGFRHVPDPLLLTNSTGAPLYYLVFASPNKTGAEVMNWIFGYFGRNSPRAVRARR